MKAYCCCLSLLWVVCLACTKNSPPLLPPKPIKPVVDTPKIYAVTPNMGVIGDTVLISGTNLTTATSGDSVFFNGTSAQVVSAASTNVKVVVPTHASTGTITIKVAGSSASSGGPFVVQTLNVYAAGWIDSASEKKPTYWKNGEAIYLSPHFSPVYYNDFLTAMYVKDNDVYTTSAGDYPTYWRNTVMVNWPAAPITRNSIYVVGTDVYVGGYDTTAKYSKNGVETTIVNPPFYYRRGYGTIRSYGMVVSNSDVYLAGITRPTDVKSRAVYWKNQEFVPLSDTANDASGNAIFVSGTDVFVAGYETSNAVKVAKYWKNGVSVSLGDGVNPSVATSLSVNNSNVYVCGYQIKNLISQALMWKNGAQISLDNSGKTSIATSITAVGNNVFTAGSINHTATLWRNTLPTALSSAAKDSSGANAVFVTLQ